MADDYPSQLTGDSAGLNGILSANALGADSEPKKIKAGTDRDFHEGVSKAIGTIEESQKELQNLPKLKPPELAKPPNPADFQSDPMQKLGSAGSMIAALGSLLTRKHLTNAFNNMAEVNKSIDAGDASKFKSAYDEWKVNNENTLKVADWNQKNLEDLSRRLKEREAGAEEEARLYAVATENPSLANAVKTGQIQRYIDDHKQWTSDYNEAQETVKLRHDFIQAGLDEAEAKKGSPLTQAEVADVSVARKKEFDAKPAAKTTQTPSAVDWESLKPESVVPNTGLTLRALDQKVETLKNGGSYTDAGVPMRTNNNPLKDAVDDRLAVKYPDFNRVEAEIGLAGDKAEARKEGIIAGSLKTASNLLDQSIPLLREASKTIDQSNWTDLNSFENYFKTHRNDPNLVKFRVALQTTMNDYTALGVRNGQTSDHARTSTEKLVNDLMSKRGIDAFADQIEKEKESVLKGVDVTRGKKSSSTDETKTIDGFTYKKIDGEWHSL